MSLGQCLNCGGFTQIPRHTSLDCTYDFQYDNFRDTAAMKSEDYGRCVNRGMRGEHRRPRNRSSARRILGFSEKRRADLTLNKL